MNRTVFVLPTVASTNAYLKERGHTLAHGALCYTGAQQAGHGRHARSWTAAPDGQMLAMSMLFRKNIDMSPLPFICGLAVAAALEELTDVSFDIKWPNDIVCRGRKVCGILCEGRIQTDDSFTVAGIGVNLLQSAAYFEENALPQATSLKCLTGQEHSVEETARCITRHLDAWWETYEQHGMNAVLPVYKAKCTLLGRQVHLHALNGERDEEGLAVDIDQTGQLVVETAQGRKAFHAGEVSARGEQGYA